MRNTDTQKIVMKIFKVALLMVAFISQLTVYASYAPDYDANTPPDVTKSILRCLTVQECITEYSEKYDVPRAKLDYIVKNESQYKESAIGDMNLTCRRTGLPVRARGILQITECYYPEISDECAFDAKCSLETMLPIMADKERCISQWSTCRDYFNLAR